MSRTGISTTVGLGSELRTATSSLTIQPVRNPLENTPRTNDITPATMSLPLWRVPKSLSRRAPENLDEIAFNSRRCRCGGRTSATVPDSPEATSSSGGILRDGSEGAGVLPSMRPHLSFCACASHFTRQCFPNFVLFIIQLSLLIAWVQSAVSGTQTSVARGAFLSPRSLWEVRNSIMAATSSTRTEPMGWLPSPLTSLPVATATSRARFACV